MKIKRIVKALTAGIVLASAASFASAATINVGGVNFDPSSDYDFVTHGGLFEQVVAHPGDTVQGFGLINNINEDTDTSQFCPHCQLTYTFGGFKLVDSDPAHLTFTGGWVNFYVQDTSAANYTVYDPKKVGGNAGDGTLWLSLVGHTDTRAGYIDAGTLFGHLDSGTLGTGTERGQGGGLLDVTGGLAAQNINTNSQADSNGGFADLNFTSTFLPTQSGAVTAGAPPLTGDATFTGNSIPEPTTVLLLGIGLCAVGYAGKQRQGRG